LKIVVFAITPAQVHTFRNIVRTLENKEHQVKLIVRDHADVLPLLNTYGIKYSLCGKARKSRYTKYLEAVPQVLKAYRIARRFDPDVLLGGSLAAFIGFFLRKPCFVLGDTDVKTIQNLFVTRNPFVKIIITPALFNLDLGKKHFRCNMYKELAYLHPNYYKPDPSIYDLLGIGKDDKYVILRFNAFDSAHDTGRHGFSFSEKLELVEQLRKYAYIFISYQSELPKELEPYKLPIPPHRIHDALYYAQLLVCDTGTMATEAAVLGTPAVNYSSFAAYLGNFIELERKYNLIYSFRQFEPAIKKAAELLQQPDLKEQWAKKRQRVLADKVDITQLVVWAIENYPQSLSKVKEDSSIPKTVK